MVVATVHSLAGMRLAEKLGTRDADVLELRADALEGKMGEVRRFLAAVKLPVLLTVRHPAEGGIGNLSGNRRREIFRELLPFATLVDVELRSLAAMRQVLAEARGQGTGIVVSSHDFHKTPSLAELTKRRNRAFAAGADIFKVAALADDAGSVARLLDFISTAKARRFAVMGMGKLGKASRLVLACAGSTLNYGYLDKPNAPGQWEAKELKALLVRLCR